MEAQAYAELPCSEVWGGNGQAKHGVRLPGLDGAVFSQPCLSGRGGDVYYASACSAGIFSRVYLADVVGHGEQVAEMSAWLHDTLKRNMNHYDTDAIFSEVNGHVFKRGFEALTTAACFTYDAKKARLNYCYAGHPPILHYRHSAGRWEALEAPHDRSGVRNISFGVTPEAQYDVAECQLETGDMLLLYSDGLTEARDAEQVLFGETRLLECLKDPASRGCADLIENLVQSIHAHTGKSPLDHDDVTVLAFRVGEPLSGSILRIALRNRLRRWELQRQAKAV